MFMERVVHKKFWVVWCAFRGEPTKSHGTLDEASKEAMRLAVKHPEKSFYVLEAVEEVCGAVTLVKYPLEVFDGEQQL